MAWRLVLAGVSGVAVVLMAFFGWADEPAKPKRVAWTTSKVRGSPDPASPYRTEVAFPKLKFDEPLDITTGPGSDRLFICERFGRIYSIPNDPKVEKPDLLLDVNEVLGRATAKSLAVYGLALHPKFATNGYVYVTYVARPEKEEPKGTRVSRFKASGDPPRCDPKSETPIIEWQSGGHNGGALEFGPDGFLYIATGDGSGIADQYQTGQDVTSLAGKILRIDVDNSDKGLAYSIPKDNPFVATPNARPEIWAYGLRQPWKFSFDKKTGDCWCGNVGQDLWEQIYLIEKGGNYGWSVLEGSHPFRPERPRGPSQIIMPIVEHDHANFRSITGGFVYHGQRLKDLTGAYIYGDYDTGRIWAFRYDRTRKSVSDHRELFDSNLRLIDFAEDKTGELFLLDHMSGRISRLIPNPAAAQPQDFPRKLSDTGLFASTKDHRPAPGLVPYDVIAPQWVDGAKKERFLALPGMSQMDFEAMLYPFAPNAPPGWKFPDGTVIVETITLDTAKGHRRLETRILHHERLTGSEEVGDQYWQGYTYVWNDEQTDAVLLEDSQGLDRVYTVRDGLTPGGERQQTWHFPSRTECIACHNMAAKYAIGLQTPMLSAQQLSEFDRLGLFSKPLPGSPEDMARLVNYADGREDLNQRARSYLHANCGHCHRKWGGGNAEFHLTATWDLAEMGIVNVRPGQGTFGIPGARLVVPGDPYRSVLFYRVSTIGPGHMPRLGSSVIDEFGVGLMHDWIASLPGTGMLAPQAIRTIVEQNTALERLKSARLDFDKLVDPFLNSTPAALRLAKALPGQAYDHVRLPAARRAAKVETPEIRDLFERFLPEPERIKRLGAVVKAEQILAIPGDAARGRKLFFEGQGVACRNCHRIDGKGTELGPDLDRIGQKYDRAKILENILNPSKDIDPKYLTWQVETKTGKVYSGIVVSKDGTKTVLRDAQNKLQEVREADVEFMRPQQKSLMPDLLLREMTAEQVADLTAFLSGLK